MERRRARNKVYRVINLNIYLGSQFGRFSQNKFSEKNGNLFFLDSLLSVPFKNCFFLWFQVSAVLNGVPKILFYSNSEIIENNQLSPTTDLLNAALWKCFQIIPETLFQNFKLVSPVSSNQLFPTSPLLNSNF